MKYFIYSKTEMHTVSRSRYLLITYSLAIENENETNQTIN